MANADAKKDLLAMFLERKRIETQMIDNTERILEILKADEDVQVNKEQVIKAITPIPDAPETNRPIAEVSDSEIETMVTNVIREIGIPANIKGYRYLRTAITMAIKDMGLIDKITTRLYPEVAKLHNTTASRVERAIRHAIEVACDRSDYSVFQKWFGYTISPSKAKPTNSEFVAVIADNLIMELKRL